MGFFSDDSDQAQAYESVSRSVASLLLMFDLNVVDAGEDSQGSALSRAPRRSSRLRGWYSNKVLYHMPLTSPPHEQGESRKSRVRFPRHRHSFNLDVFAVAANGHPDSHAMAKELLAGFAGAFIDREVETKGVSHHLKLFDSSL